MELVEELAGGDGRTAGIGGETDGERSGGRCGGGGRRQEPRLLGNCSSDIVQKAINNTDVDAIARQVGG